MNFKLSAENFNQVMHIYKRNCFDVAIKDDSVYVRAPYGIVRFVGFDDSADAVSYLVNLDGIDAIAYPGTFVCFTPTTLTVMVKATSGVKLTQEIIYHIESKSNSSLAVFKFVRVVSSFRALPDDFVETYKRLSKFTGVGTVHRFNVDSIGIANCGVVASDGCIYGQSKNSPIVYKAINAEYNNECDPKLPMKDKLNSTGLLISGKIPFKKGAVKCSLVQMDDATYYLHFIQDGLDIYAYIFDGRLAVLPDKYQDSGADLAFVLMNEERKRLLKMFYGAHNEDNIVLQCIGGQLAFYFVTNDEVKVQSAVVTNIPVHHEEGFIAVAGFGRFKEVMKIPSELRFHFIGNANAETVFDIEADNLRIWLTSTKDTAPSYPDLEKEKVKTLRKPGFGSLVDICDFGDISNADKILQF